MSSPFEFTVPSLDRPYGFYLWDIFSYCAKEVSGWDPKSFEFIQGGLPLSTTTPALAAIAIYYVVIFGGREIMNNFQPKKLNLLFQIHNFFLTALSLLLFLLLVEQLIPIVFRHGILYAICDKAAWTQPIVTVYYMNYLTKYLELIDTVFLVLKKKPLTFLHTYHHGATALLCYTQLIGNTSVSWVPIVLNLFVHIIMYWYYFLSASGIRVWWKEWVTRTQIIQFVIDLVFVYFASYTYFVSTYWPTLPNMGSCAGEEFAAISGCGILTSYLFLFIGFYIRVYKKVAARASKKVAAAASTGASSSGASSSVAGSSGSVKSRKA